MSEAVSGFSSIKDSLQIARTVGFKNFFQSIFSKNINKQADPLAKEINIEFLENKNSFSEQDWKELYKLSEETFVEESESLKSKAAGAGLTDND